MSTQLTIASADRFDALALIDRLDRAQSTKNKYKRALLRYLNTGNNLTDADALARHADSLPPSGRAFLKAAVGHIAKGIASQAKGMATPENVNQVQATLYRAEALQEAIHVEESKGQKSHPDSKARKASRLPSAALGAIMVTTSAMLSSVFFRSHNRMGVGQCIQLTFGVNRRGPYLPPDCSTGCWHACSSWQWISSMGANGHSLNSRYWK